MKQPLALATALLALTPALASAQAQPATGDAFTFYSAGLDAILTDPRDAGLKSALELADGRLAELVQEIDDLDLPPETLQLLFEMLRSPMSLRIGIEDPQGGLPVSAELHVEQTSAEDALAFSTRVESLLALVLPIPLSPVAGAPGLKLLETPVAGVRLGTPEGARRFEVSLGEPRLAAFDPARFTLPAGVQPTLAMTLDTGPLRGPIEMLLAGEEDGETVRAQLEAFGLLSEHPLKLELAWGAGHLAGSYQGWAHLAGKMGALVREPLTAEEIRLVPADAVSVSLSKFRAASILKYFQVAGDESEEVLEQIRAEGIDLEELLGQLGTTLGFYLSDTTGGGGFASAAGFLTLSDPTGLLGTIERLAARANELGRNEVEGRVRIRSFGHDGARCFGLTFPGLPIPVEPALAIVDDVLFFAATPQGLVAALDHAVSGAPGLADAPGVRDSGLAPLEGITSVTFDDTQRHLADGYGMASLLFSGLANALRSPEDVSREPGIVMPSYRALARGARPYVLVSRIVGDDLHVQGESDPSVVATVTAAIPGPLSWIMGTALLTGVVTPGIVRNIEQTQAIVEQLEAEPQALEEEAHHEEAHAHDHQER